MAFREKGHEAYSCDLVECSGGHPEWHIQGDVRRIINGASDDYYCELEFYTQDGSYHLLPWKWDMIIAHPPCTYLTVSGNRWFNVERYGDKAIQRAEEREKAVEFFMEFANANCDRICIENPIGVMSTRWRKPDQVIQPYEYGHPARKATCLWLKNLKNLHPTEIVEPEIYSYLAANGRIKTDSRWRCKCKKKDRAAFRSKTFPGIAKAMADQWG